MVKRKWKDMKSYTDIEQSKRLAEILHCFSEVVEHSSDGFYTSHGRYVDRYEAARIAIEVIEENNPYKE